MAGPLAATAADPARPDALRESAAAVLTGYAGSPAGLAALRTALDALAAQGSSGAPDGQRSALRILHHLVDRHGPTPAAALDVLTDALLRAGLRRTAARVALEAALSAMREGDPAPAQWDRWLVLAADHPYGLDLGRGQYLDHHGTLSPAVHRTVVSLRDRGTPAAGLVAVELVGAAGRRSGWRAPWPAELAALCADADPGVAESALLVDLGRSSD
ncbi:hypothetical protein [Streptomyces sp. PH10-H1]|uniref:hypothetical protein n=1 Tax=Streptomyces sp. PH10-H1 TaxID=3046212 RepID=UPI0024B9BAC3|nr:hypothetical protein [Streptomyces sp. PH10-H1]MDJ0343001.1 hypothetical protein [Streptomyces sp. PH10-H1]